ncbi:MAG: class I tRNA ligase family protein, partial [Proteobacteria bacterium]|nr:class I tRNA ligase family protein [Pseudomonadota bacterium]
MRLHNTLSGKRETFSTADNKVRMYVCGITPYSASHIGHAMSSVAFDIVRRYLEFKGYEVIHIQNFTDIDDKMIKTAADQGISIGELAEINIQAYLDEMDTLNVLRASNYPR